MNATAQIDLGLCVGCHGMGCVDCAGSGRRQPPKHDTMEVRDLLAVWLAEQGIGFELTAESSFIKVRLTGEREEEF